MDPSTDGRDPRTPVHAARPDDSGRPIYERVKAAAWPLITGPLVAHGVDGRAYVEREVSRRPRPVAEHLSYAAVAPIEQEAFLRALPAVVANEWRAAKCACRGCRAWDWTRGLNATYPVFRRRLFVVVIVSTLVEAWGAQHPHDHALGMPRPLLRHPLAWHGGDRIVEGAPPGIRQS